MGAWSEENFGNDDAGDWVYSLEKSKGVETLLNPIKTILANNDYLEAPDCSEALAASEVVAAGLTGDHSCIPNEVSGWLKRKPWLFGSRPKLESDHAKLAHDSVTKILNESELKDLWQESEDYEKWKSIQTSLLSKLSNV